MTISERARTLTANLELLDARIVFSDVPAATLAILAALEETRREAWEEALSRIFDPTARVLIRALIDGPRQGGTEL